MYFNGQGNDSSVDHVQFDSGFHVMTISEFACNSPEVTHFFLPHHTMMSLVVGLKEDTSDSPRRFILFFSSVWAVLDQGGCSQILIFSRSLKCSICDWEYKFFIFVGVNTSFALSLRAWSSAAFISPNSSMSATIMYISSRPDWNSTADVPSLILRTALSAIPFVSDLCGVDVQ